MITRTLFVPHVPLTAAIAAISAVGVVGTVGAGCSNGSNLNRKICDPGAAECTETGARICNPQGTLWVDGTCPTGEACVDGAPDECREVVCAPGERACDANGVFIMECDDTGTSRCAIENCAAAPRDGICDRGACVAVCTAEQKSYLGCEYFAADLDNATVDCDGDPRTSEFCDAAGSQYSVVVSNPDPARVAFVIITKGPVTGGDIDAAVCDANPSAPTNFVAAKRIPPRGIHIFDLPARNINATVQAELAYRVASNIPITVYQFNPLENVDVFSNDASLLLPTTAAGAAYIVMSRQEVNPLLRGFLTVVGVDRIPTEVTVRVTARTQGGNGIPALQSGEEYTTTLKRFEVLNIETNEAGGDLTGSTVQANRSVVVFGGHEGAIAPDSRCDLMTNTCEFNTGVQCGCQPEDTECNPHEPCLPIGICCADHLEQQLFPLSAWGRSYVAVRSWRRGAEMDIWRILAAEDDTVVVLDPPVAAVPTLGAGQHFEFESGEDFFITASNPIMVGQFLAGERAPRPGVQPDDANIGDPAFILAAPARQLRDSYVFLAPNKYAEDYVSIGVPVGGTVRVDGDDVFDPQSFPLARISGPIGSSGWQSIRTRISDGFHTVECDTTCSIMVHGYDRAVSYGYPGGLNLLECATNQDCPPERPVCDENSVCVLN